MVFGSFLKKFIVSLVVFSFVFVTFGCASQDSEFPNIPAPSVDVENTFLEESIEQSVVEYNKLKVALPYSEETINYLFRLYYAKSNGLISSDDTGSTISLDFLNSLVIPFSIESVYIPDTGVSVDLINDMGADAPDLFITNELDECISSNVCASLNEYTSSNMLIDSDNVYVLPLLACVKDENLYAIPHYMSVPLIYCNVDFLPEESDPDFKISLKDLNKIIRRIGVEDSESDVIPFVAAKELIPYIGSAFLNTNSSVRSYALHDEYYLDSSSAEKIFEAELDYINSYYSDSFSLDSNEDGSDPIISRNAAMWISPSSEIMYLNSYYPNKLIYMQMPTFMDSNKTIPVATIYPICVSSKSEQKSLAADFATFISYDSDALLLTKRFESKVGMLPVISTPSVWDELINNETFGYIASIYENEMNNLICSSEIIDSESYNDIQNSISNYYKNTNENKSLKLDNFYD